jgi:hypothetical protein
MHKNPRIRHNAPKAPLKIAKIKPNTINKNPATGINNIVGFISESSAANICTIPRTKSIT